MSDSEEKNLPASDKKLSDAREKGQVPKSTDLVSGAVTLAGFGYVAAITTAFVSVGVKMIDESVQATTRPFSETVKPFVGTVAWLSIAVVAPMLLLIVMAAALSSVLAMGGVVVAFDPLTPKLSHLDPVEGFAKLFKLDKLIALLKDLLKLVVVISISVVLIRSSFGVLVQQPVCGLKCTPAAVASTLLPIMVMASILFVVVGIVDVSIQRWLFARNMRMSATEQKQERKNSDGDPHVKAAQSRIRKESLQLLTGLRQATFVVTGKHCAVGLRYALPVTSVPTLVIQSRDERVPDLLLAAREMRLPEHFDPELAQEIMESVKIGVAVPKELYSRVIAVMRTLGIPLKDE